MRAFQPTRSGLLHLEGFQVAYESFGDPTRPALLLLPPWQIVHSRIWKMQVVYFSRAFHVVTFDAPGNGLAQRTTDPAAYEYERVARQGMGILDHLGVERVSLLGFSRSCAYCIWLAATFPERIDRAVLIGNGVTPDDWGNPPPASFHERRKTYRGGEKGNAFYWREHYDDWLTFFFGLVFPEPHSTKGLDDSTSWGLETDAENLIASLSRPELWPTMPVHEAIAAIRCPVLLIHGDNDRCHSIQASHALAAARPDWELVVLENCGHASIARDPVRANLAIAEFIERGGQQAEPQVRHWQRAMDRPRRALYISSPIGLGHVQRDLAIARELRRIVPDLQIDWLAQPPVTSVLEQAGERIHPLSEQLASESAHWEEAAGDHQLHCFNAFREMDEILLANFMVFLEAARETPYDLWLGDEAWEVDHFLHENPELKTAPYVFMTDFLGWLPIDDTPGSREAFLTADYNAEMIEHIDRFPSIRDRALYFGEYDDLVPDRFGPDLPVIRDWAREHMTAVGYVVPFDPADYADTKAVRQRLGYDPEQPLLIAAVGGTAVGRRLLDKVVDAWPLIQRERPDLRCIVVAGPRIDPEALPTLPGLEVRPYIHNLYEHLAVADLAIVQGGLGTTMELVVNRRPFLYFPLRDHCEQIFHVAHRLACHNAGVRMDYDTTTPESLAATALATLGTTTHDYRCPDPQAASKAAMLIAELL